MKLDTLVNAIAVWALINLFLLTVWLAVCSFRREHFPCDDEWVEYPRSNVRVIRNEEAV